MIVPSRIKGLHDVNLSGVAKDQIRFIDIYFSGACDLRCSYCFTDHRKGRLTTDDRKNLLYQARELGAQSFVSTGAGEPTLDPGFQEVIKYANDLGMTSVIYTNGNNITKEMARFMYEKDVSPLVKLESLDPKVHEAITRKKGSYHTARRGIENLLEAGYGEVIDGTTRMGIAAVYTKLNIEGFEQLKKYCDKKGLLFMADELGLEKSALQNMQELYVERSKIDRVKYSLGIVESGIGAPARKEGSTCNFADYGIRIDQDGNVSYCTMQDLGGIVGNALEEGLAGVIKGVRIAKLVAIREKMKTIRQVNAALERNNTGILIALDHRTCPFKAGDNLEVRNANKE